MQFACAIEFDDGAERARMSIEEIFGSSSVTDLYGGHVVTEVQYVAV